MRKGTVATAARLAIVPPDCCPPDDDRAPVRLLLAAEDAESAKPLRAALAAVSGSVVVGEARDFDALVAATARLRPDVVVVAILFPVRTMAALRDHPAHAAVVAHLTGRLVLVAGMPRGTGDQIAAACGASAYVPRDRVAEELASAVAAVAARGRGPAGALTPRHSEG